MDVYGYNGMAYTEGDRVELHPATDWWMAGAKFGTVERITLQRISLTETRPRVRVKLDRNGRTVTGTDVTFRKAV